MKIKQVHAFLLNFTSPFVAKPKGPTPPPTWWDTAEVVSPMARHARFKRLRSSWRIRPTVVACRVEAEDGTWGLGMTRYGTPVAALINEHYAPLLVGEPALATERMWDILVRAASPYSAAGLASYAISAVDLAMWDLKGKLLGKPVYELLGGPARDKQPCYATGNDPDWHARLKFSGSKLACPYGPADGLDGLAKNEEFVGRAREAIGRNRELMLDCWMALDIEYAVRLAERLRPYGLRWLEDSLMPEDLESHIELRRRLPWHGLATGEHWYGVHPFAYAANHRVADVLQPDVEWAGGITACVRICHIAEAAGITVIPHCGMNTPYGQHFVYAMPNSPLGEYFIGSPPGVALEETTVIPGMAQPKDGMLVPSNGPGFGMEIDDRWLDSMKA
jgi:L-rhamnonate dehydratase